MHMHMYTCACACACACHVHVHVHAHVHVDMLHVHVATAIAGLLQRRCRRRASFLAALSLPEGRDRLGEVDDHRGDVVSVVPLDLRPADGRAHDQQVRSVRRRHAQLLGARDDADRLAAVDELPHAVGSEDEEEVLRLDRARAHRRR
jgi:hypothetical protein